MVECLGFAAELTSVFIGEGIIKNTTQAFNRFLEDYENPLFRYNKLDSLQIFLLTRVRFLDFAGLKAIRHYHKRLLNVSRVF